jgi:hypothetical protein
MDFAAKAITVAVLPQRLAKYFLLGCFRNSVLEDCHRSCAASEVACERSSNSV